MEDEYDSVVFLDADTLVLENIDELFDCGPFCAVMRHSELLNSGVVVITPSKELYKHMHDLIGELDSYTGGDQGFLNSFYPYFAACPAFEPYPIVGSRLGGVGSGYKDSEGDLWVGGPSAKGGGAGAVRAGNPPPRGGKRELGSWMKPQGWGCKRLPSRYNGDWPLLFVDGDLQVVQGKEAGPDAPADWKRRKKLKVLHFTFGTAKPWNWWTYPFLPYVDLWLEAFHRVAGRVSPHGGGGDKSESQRRKQRRPRWSGVVGQVIWGLAPIALVVGISRATKRWETPYRMLCKAGHFGARYAVPLKALNPRSLLGSIFNLLVGLVLALTAAVLAFKAVPTERLGAARPEAAWAFFWGRATALIVVFEGLYLFLILLKVRQVFVNPPGEGGAPYASISSLAPAEDDSLSASTPAMGDGGLRRDALDGVGVGGVVEAFGKKGGVRVGGTCGARRVAMTETLTHLAVLSAMTASLVSAPLRAGLNGAPASREIIPGLLHFFTLLVAFTFSAVRLPPVWAAHARACDGNHRDLRSSRSDCREMEATSALGNLSPLSNHHHA